MFPHREFISRKKKIEEVKLLRDGVVQGRGQGVFMGTIGTGKGKGKGTGKGTGVGKGNYDRKGKKNPAIESSRLIPAEMTVDSTVINKETVSEILDPSSPIHLEDLRSDKVTKDENPNIESFVLQSSISDMIIVPQKIEKSGSAALKIPKKKAVVKKKKKSKINFTSLQKKKAKIVSS